MIFSVDRIENNILICFDEQSNRKEIDISSACDDIHEGDIIDFKDGKITVLKEETERRRKEIIEMQNKLWK